MSSITVSSMFYDIYKIYFYTNKQKSYKYFLHKKQYVEKFVSSPSNST